MENNRIADEIFNEILSDLTGRSGLGDTWDSIDTEIQEEIKVKWKNIILITLKKHN